MSILQQMIWQVINEVEEPDVLEDLKVSSDVIKDALDEEKDVTLKRSKGEKSNGKSWC